MNAFAIWRGVLACALAAAVNFAAAAPQARNDSRAAAVQGRVLVHGCSIAPGDLLVRARPIIAPTTAGSGTASTVVVPAQAVRGSPDFTFSIPGLDEKFVYRVGVKVLDPSVAKCVRLVWRIDREPVVRPGDAPLRFDGYAVRDAFEVRADQTMADEIVGGKRVGARPAWVGVDALDYLDPSDAYRQFRWRSALPGVTGGRLQVSLAPFARVGETDYDPCKPSARGAEPILSLDFPAARGRWTATPPVDFHTLLATRRGRAAGPGVDVHTAEKLAAGMPVYVRVLPLVGTRVECNTRRIGAPPEVKLARLLLSFKGTPSPDPTITSPGPIIYSGPVFNAGRPDLKHTPCYVALKDHKLPVKLPGDLFFPSSATSWDVSVWAAGGASWGQTFKKGSGFCQKQGDDDAGWLESAVDSFSSVISAVVDAIGNVVNFTSKLWESIQDSVVAAVGDVIGKLSFGLINCGEGTPCRAALETGLEVALASMGVPPDLPNFDQLVDQGFDYMAAQVASQVGVPTELVDYASDKSREFVKKSAAEMRSDYAVPKLPDWLAPTLLFEPAFIVVPLRGMGKNHPYATTPLLIRKNETVFDGAMVALPRMLPDASEPPLILPMALPANLDGLPPPPKGYSSYEQARVAKDYWIKLRYGMCYPLYLVALSSPGGVQKVVDLKFSSKDATPCVP